ncbi:MAG: TonB-dependent receptor domain-containing protein, partial [Blastocatellia bacterium]
GQAVSVGAFEGTIADQNGAVIAGATITASNKATGAERTGVTDSGGYYRIAGLTPGVYRVKIEAKGFASQVNEDVTLNVGITLTINAALKPGGTAETVIVNAGDAPLIETSKTELAGVVNNREIENLPLNGRSFSGLAILIPGARPTGSYDPTKQRVAVFSINGSSGRNVNTTVDGGDNKDNTVGGIVMQFSLEGVQEYKLETQRFSAASGRSEGAALNVISKSGSNRFHGSGFVFERDRKFNANDYISDFSKQPKAPFSRQQFGGSFGGPIKTDRFFFFGTYERTREETSFNVDQSVFDELQFASSIGAKPLKVVPTPYRDNLWQARLDGKLSDKHTGFVKWAEQRNKVLNDQGGITDETGGNFNRNNLLQGVLGLTSSITPAVVNQFTFAYQYWNNLIDTDVFAPRVTFPTGGFGTNTNVPQQSIQKKYQFKDDLFWTVGNHGLKMGVDYVAIPKLGGFFKFNATPNVTFFDRASIVATDKVKYPQGFATPGAVQTLTATAGDPAFNYVDTGMFSAYFQDDWKINPRFTLNLGLRYDLDINFLPSLPNNKTYLLLKQINHPITQKLLGDDTNNVAPRVGFAYDIGGNAKNVVRGGYGLYHAQVFQNIPLFAQQHTNPTIFATVLSYTASFTPGVPQSPQTNTEPFLRTFRYGVDPINIPAPSANLPNNSVGRIMSPDAVLPYTQQFNIGYSRQLSNDYALEVDYIHVLGLHEFYRRRLNPRVPGNTVRNINGQNVTNARLLAADFVRAGLDANRLADVVLEDSIGRSRYDGLNIQLKKRFSSRFTFQTSYVLSRGLAYGGNAAAFGGLPEDQNNIFAPGELGPTPQDERHRFVFSGVFDLWWGVQFSPIIQLASPRAYTLADGTDLNGDGVNNDRFRVNGQPVPRGSQRGGFLRALNAQGGIVAGEEISGRFFLTDIRVSKYIKFGDTAKLGLFFEAFNLFNTLNSGNTFNTNSRSNLFKVITGYMGGAGNPFQAQFGARFTF